MAVNFGLIGQVPGFSDVLAGAQGVAQQQRSNFLQQLQMRDLQQGETKLRLQQQQLSRRAELGKLAASGDVGGARRGALSAGDLELADAFGKLDEQQRAMVGNKIKAAGPVLLAASQVPYEQRRQVIGSAAQGLLAAGWTPQELESFDPTDQAIQGIVAQNRTVEGILSERKDERDFAYRRENDEANRGVTVRGQDISNANAAASRAVAVRGQNLADARARQSNIISAAGVGRNQIKGEADLRRQFDALPEVKEFKDVRNSWRQIGNLATGKPTAQNDIALIFSYMKMLDPGSVVREGEFAVAARAAGVPDRLVNIIGRAESGKLLNERQRTEMVRAASQVYQSRRDSYNTAAAQYRGYAQDYGLDAGRVARRYVDDPKRGNGNPKSNVVNWSDLP